MTRPKWGEGTLSLWVKLTTAKSGKTGIGGGVGGRVSAEGGS